ncbi:hypothetical protein [Streptomyces hydrogenans]|uniref:hypothetical protein n=1 Tax=Streptomyces hydrogenans TaxID=1873719 RepID=UPI0038006B7A
MAISYVAGTKAPTSYPGAANNTSTCDIAKPAGTTSGDVLVAFIITAGAIITPPAGWTLIHNFNHSAGNFVTNAYYRVAGGSEGASYLFTDDNASGALRYLLRGSAMGPPAFGSGMTSPPCC